MSLGKVIVPRTPPIKRMALSDWLKGYQSVFDDDRQTQNALKISSNVLIEQNGTVRPRYSMVPYGINPPGTVLGTIYPYVDATSGTPINKQICVCVVGGVANVYTNQDGGVWTLRTGKTFNTTASVHYEQIDNAVLISNGVDNLSYFDIPTNAVIPFTSLTTPTGLSLAATGLTGTNFTYRYRISAVGNGETAACAAVTQQVSKVRDQWAGGTTEFINITWNRVTGATRYNIYAGDQAGFEYYLDTVSDPGSGTTITYKDDSSLVLNTNRIAPNGDSTAGPTVTRCRNVLGQIFMVGDTTNLWRLWFGGTGAQALDFSAFDGGGWVDIDLGGKDLPVNTVGFRDGRGNPVATVFMKGQAGKGKLIHAAMTSTTVGTTVITYASLQEANGEDSTDAPDGIIFANDSLWYPSRDGFKTTGTKAQIQEILSTSDFSDQILPDIKNLNVKNMSSCVGIEWEGRLIWFLPVGSTTNNQAWVLDLKRGAIWTNPWYMNVDWAWKYDDSGGTTHLMVLSGNKIYELSYGQLTQDGTTPFRTDIGSGMIKFSPDGMMWASVLDVTFVFERPQGNGIQVSVTGKTESAALTTLGSASYTPNTSPAGWNEQKKYWNNPSYYWNAVVNKPTAFQSAREEITIEIGEELKYLLWEVSSTGSNVDFQLADVIIRYVEVGTLDLT